MEGFARNIDKMKSFWVDQHRQEEAQNREANVRRFQRIQFLLHHEQEMSV
jgi:hypothetical protein